MSVCTIVFHCSAESAHATLTIQVAYILYYILCLHVECKCVCVCGGGGGGGGRSPESGPLEYIARWHFMAYVSCMYVHIIIEALYMITYMYIITTHTCIYSSQ